MNVLEGHNSIRIVYVHLCMTSGTMLGDNTLCNVRMHSVEMHEIIARQHGTLGTFSVFVIALSSQALSVFNFFCALC